jgi:hypothetical protein
LASADLKARKQVAVYVIGTDEEFIIARHTIALLAQQARTQSLLQAHQG